MKNVFYLIWVDSIVGFRKHNPDRTDWKITTFVVNTTCNALNLATIDFALNLLGIKTFVVKVDIFPLPMLNSFAGFIVQFAWPFILLNYFLIFHNERYKKLIEKYPNRNGKFAGMYVIISALVGFISMVLYGILAS